MTVPKSWSSCAMSSENSNPECDWDTAMIKLKRVYEDPSSTGGIRVLVERLWPRGLSKKRAAVDLWLKDVAPSPELRKWFGHDPARWEQFQKRYRGELREKMDAIRLLKKKDERGHGHPGRCRARRGAQRRVGPKNASSGTLAPVRIVHDQT